MWSLTTQDDEHEDYYSSRRSAARNRFEEDMEVEAQAEKRIINAKKVSLCTSDLGSACVDD